MKEVIFNNDIVHKLWNHYDGNLNFLKGKNPLNVKMTKKDLEDFIGEIYNEYKERKEYLDDKVVEEVRRNKLKVVNKYSVAFFYNLFYAEYIELWKLEDFVKLIDSDVIKDTRKYNINQSYSIDLNYIDIKDVIGRYIKLPNNLKTGNINCPLHEDKTPSFHIYTETNSFYCFGCGKGGNVINFVAEIENISTKEAFKIIKNLYFK